MNSKEKFQNSKNSGITLIALVITIIVLLILAGITIANLTGENGLLGRASQARNETEKARIKELIQLAVLSGYNENCSFDTNMIKTNITTSLPDAIIDGDELPILVVLDSIEYAIDENGNVIEPTDRIGIEIGDYIDYEPSILPTTVYPKSTLDMYSGSTDNSDITQDTLDWQVLRKYVDGSIDLIGSTTSQEIYFGGVLGYTNGVYLMDDVCKTLYSRTSSQIESRSVDLDDFEYWLNQSEEGIDARNNYTNINAIAYGDEITYTINKKYPLFYKTQKSENDVGRLITNSMIIDKEDLIINQTYYNIQINEDNYSNGYIALSSSISYWIGTRYTFCYTNYANFGLIRINTDVSGRNMVDSAGNMNNAKFVLRPVVHLKANTEITQNEGSIDEPHHIESY